MDFKFGHQQHVENAMTLVIAVDDDGST
jgi:hypothetical protein